jgi:hypothetical protein
VLSWRQTPEWEAQVVYVDPRGNVSIEWLPADEVRPLEMPTSPTQPEG